MPRLQNARNERIAREYLACGYGAQPVADRMGLSYAVVARVLQRPEVEARIVELNEDRMKAADITAQRVMLELGRLAFADIRGLYAEDGSIKPVHDLDDDTAATLAGIETEESRIVNKGARVPVLDLVTGEQAIGDDGRPLWEAQVTTVKVRKVKRYDKTQALVTLAKHFKLIGDEGDGVNALASALADRLDAAKRRLTQKGTKP